MDKRQREARRHQEDIALQRGLLWVAGAAILEGLLVLVNRFYINYAIPDGIDLAYGFHYALRGLRIAGRRRHSLHYRTQPCWPWLGR